MPLRKPKKPEYGQAFPATGQASGVPAQATMGPKPPAPPMQAATAPVGQNPAAVTPPPKSKGAQNLPATAPGTNLAPPPMQGVPLPGAPAGGPPAADIAAGVGGPTLDEAGYPLTPGSAAQRADAEQGWGNAQTEYGNSIYRAALQYGDPAILAQYGQYGPVVDNPNSDLSTINKEEGTQRVSTNNSLNNQNLFFSGVNQKAQNAITEGASGRRAGAYQKFKDSEQKLLEILARARTARDTVYRDTGASDITADLAQPPQPTGPAAGDVGGEYVGPGPDVGAVGPAGPKKSVKKTPPPKATGGKAQSRSGSKKRSPRKKK